MTAVKKENVEMTKAQLNSMCFRSELLNKYFTDWEELVKEENAYKKEHEKELKAKKDKEDALANIQALKEEYINAVKHKNEVLEEEHEKISSAYDKYVTARDEFADKYNGYHFTFRSDDKDDEVTDAYKELQDLLDEMKKIKFINPIKLFI